MTEQIFILHTPRKLLGRTLATMSKLTDHVCSMRLNTTSALVHLTHDKQTAIRSCDLVPMGFAERIWVFELDPALLKGIADHRFHGPSRMMEALIALQRLLDGQRSLQSRSNITERLVDRVLDRISQIGLEGISPFERRLLERYSHDLNLPQNEKKRRA